LGSLALCEHLPTGHQVDGKDECDEEC